MPYTDAIHCADIRDSWRMPRVSGTPRLWPSLGEVPRAGVGWSSEKEIVGRVGGFIPVGEAQGFKKAFELLAVTVWNLDADQDAAIVGAVVAIVEQADVPECAHAGEELQQCTGALGKLEAVENFMRHVRAVAADEVTHVQLGHFVAAHVQHGIAMRLEL